MDKALYFFSIQHVFSAAKKAKFDQTLTGIETSNFDRETLTAYEDFTLYLQYKRVVFILYSGRILYFLYFIVSCPPRWCVGW